MSSLFDNEVSLLGALVATLDLVGTFVFALSGAMAGVKHRLDLFGVLALSFVAATSGGILRDVLIGSVPPAAVSDWRYLVISMAAGLTTFFGYSFVDRLRSPVQIFDAAGLGLFAVVGASKALAFHLGPMAAVLMGVLTGVGGGVARDVLVREIPDVLHAELYAMTALAGSAVVVVGHLLQWPSTPTAIVGAALCFGLRFMAIRRGWRLPVAAAPERQTADRR